MNRELDEIVQLQRRIHDRLTVSIHRRYTLTVFLIVAVFVGLVGATAIVHSQHERALGDKVARLTITKDSQAAVIAAQQRVVDSVTRTALTASTALKARAAQPIARPVFTIDTARAAGPFPVIDSTWLPVLVPPDTVPHYVDTTVARILTSLDSLAVDYVGFRRAAVYTVTQLEGAIAEQHELAEDARAALVTADSLTAATAALIPTRRQRLVHDAKVVVGTAGVLGLLKAAVSILR